MDCDPTFGSGVLLAPHCILTNWHVVEKFDPLHGKIKVTFDFKKGRWARERVLGSEHPDTLSSVINLAFLHSRMGEYEKAKPLYERALEGFIKKLGVDHPHTKIVLANLEGVRGRLG